MSESDHREAAEAAIRVYEARHGEMSEMEKLIAQWFYAEGVLRAAAIVGVDVQPME